MYKILERYDNSHWRVLASAKTSAVASEQMDRERRIRHRRGYGFFETAYLKGPRGQGPYHTREISSWPEWEYAAYDNL